MVEQAVCPYLPHVLPLVGEVLIQPVKLLIHLLALLLALSSLSLLLLALLQSLHCLSLLILRLLWHLRLLWLLWLLLWYCAKRLSTCNNLIESLKNLVPLVFLNLRYGCRIGDADSEVKHPRKLLSTKYMQFGKHDGIMGYAPWYIVSLGLLRIEKKLKILHMQLSVKQVIVDLLVDDTLPHRRVVEEGLGGCPVKMPLSPLLRLF